MDRYGENVMETFWPPQIPKHVFSNWTEWEPDGESVYGIKQGNYKGVTSDLTANNADNFVTKTR